MTAPNHALTGALIGLAISNPVLALPLAFLSHFVCDAIPHYDPPETNGVKRLRSKRFFWEFLVAGAVLCLAIVTALAYAHPHHWLAAAICAFLATSPDLFWLPRFLHVRRTGRDKKLSGPFYRLHSIVQWSTGPHFIVVEAAWFITFAFILWQHL